MDTRSLILWQQIPRATADLAALLERRGDKGAAALASQIAQQLGDLLARDSMATALAQLPDPCRLALRRFIGLVVRLHVQNETHFAKPLVKSERSSSFHPLRWRSDRG